MSVVQSANVAINSHTGTVSKMVDVAADAATSGEPNVVGLVVLSVVLVVAVFSVIGLVRAVTKDK